MTPPEFDIPATFNAAEYFVHRHAREGNGNKTAIWFGDLQHTYADVSAEVNRTANLLKAQGVGAGDRVVIALPDCPAFVWSFWATIQIGAIAVPANTYLSALKFGLLLDDCRARYVVIDERLLSSLGPAFGDRTDGQGADRRGELTVLIVRNAHSDSERTEAAHAGVSPEELLAGDDPNRVRVLDYERERSGHAPQADSATTRREDPALLLYTSGSAGEPKGALHCHRDMAYCTEAFASCVLGMSPADRCFSASKLFFAYGLGNGLYYPFGFGAETILDSESMTAKRFCAAISRYRPTLVFAVPSLYAAVLRLSNVTGDDFRSVRCAVSAGEALPITVAEQFETRFGIALLDGIGSTEMLQTFISNRPHDVRRGSCGKPVPGYEAKIVDEAGNEVAEGEIGDLWIKGGSAASGYWNRPRETATVFRREWTVTGDKCRIDEEGYYWHCGRSDDLLKINGLWVSPTEIESALLLHPEVRECAVTGFKNSDGFVRPRAFITLKIRDSQSCLDEVKGELISFLRGRLAAHKLPADFVFLEEMPRTATGKIQRFKLRGEQENATGDSDLPQQATSVLP